VSTQTVVDEIKLKAPGWARDGSSAILQKLDQCQKFMFSKACNQTVRIDGTTGKHPYLVTTENQYEYELADISMTIDGIPRTIRMARALEIYIPNGAVSEYQTLMLDPLRPGFEGVGEVRPDRIILNCTLIPATESNKAKVVFSTNPGSYATRYRMKVLLEPLRLTEDTIPLMVEEQWEPDLIEGVLALIERADYGRSDRWTAFANDACIRFWAQGNEANHEGKQRNTPPRLL